MPKNIKQDIHNKITKELPKIFKRTPTQETELKHVLNFADAFSKKIESDAKGRRGKLLNTDAVEAQVHSMTDKQLTAALQRTSKILNLRLRSIEKVGLETSSNFYNDVVEARKRNAKYITYTKAGEMKYVTNFKSLDTQGKRDLLRKYLSFTKLKTSTVKGTREADRNRKEGIKRVTVDRAKERKLNPKVIDKLEQMDASRYNEVAKMLRERGLISHYDSSYAEAIGDLVDKTDQQIVNILDRFVDYIANAPNGEVAVDDALDYIHTTAQQFDSL